MRRNAAAGRSACGRTGSRSEVTLRSPNPSRLTFRLTHPNVNVSYIHMRPSMMSAANQDTYGPRGWNQGPWGNTQNTQWQANSGPGWANPNQSWGNSGWG